MLLFKKYQRSFELRKTKVLETLQNDQGNNERRDDFTGVGFEPGVLAKLSLKVPSIHIDQFSDFP